MTKYFLCTRDFYMNDREKYPSPSFKAGTVYVGAFNGNGPTNKDLEIMASNDRMHQQDIYFKFTNDEDDLHLMDWLTLLIYFQEVKIKLHYVSL
jgi:hypothetical protein